MEEYSGLEVVPNAPHEYQSHSTSYPQSTLNAEQTGYPEAVSPEKEIPHNPSPAAITQHLSEGGAAPGEKPNRTCNIPTRKFYFLLIIFVILIIGAIAAGLAAGLTRKHSSSENQTIMPNVNILTYSRISATNWTDPSGLTHRYVFFQDTLGSMIARKWDSQNRTWATDNLTDILSASGTPITPLQPSTPLASVSIYSNLTNAVHVFFLSIESTVNAIITQTPLADPASWTLGPIYQSRLLTAPGSQLASAWNRCPSGDCAGSWSVAYQDPTFGTWIANGSNTATPDNILGAGILAQNSSFVMFPRLDYNSTSLTALALMAESVTSATTGTAQQLSYLDSAWGISSSVLPNANLTPPTPRLQFAMSTLDNFNTPVYLALLEDGTVTGEYLRFGSSRSEIPTVDFRGGPSVNFSAIAVSEEAIFYGISNDTIIQYSINSTDPSYFDYMATIYP
ncbi:hypothetical protein F5Y16DRAFT_71895 [Xylariaceae sp. FL0255]|nr:hypothetical protein F5Y16DRAFT_71895 [Xylariaceae sp. FL0255]